MAERNPNKNQTSKIITENEKVVEVLYQKMAGRWYSFYVIDEDVFMSQVPEEVALAAKSAHIGAENEK